MAAERGVLQAAVGALAVLSAEHIDPTTLAAHIATITTLLDTLRTVGMNMYGTFYDAVLAPVLIPLRFVVVAVLADQSYRPGLGVLAYLIDIAPSLQQRKCA